jgi:hypothetical protein
VYNLFGVEIEAGGERMRFSVRLNKNKSTPTSKDPSSIMDEFTKTS